MCWRAGRKARIAKYFDIDWSSPDPRLRGKVLAPVLGDRYHRVLAKRELQMETRRGMCLLRYGENAFPINAPSLEIGHGESGGTQRQSRCAGRLDRKAILSPGLVRPRRQRSELPALFQYLHPARPLHGGRAGLRAGIRPGPAMDATRLAGRLARGPSRWLARPATILAASQAGSRRMPGSLSRRFWSRANPCPRPGRSPARPATIFSTRPAVCLWIPTARNR